MFDVILNNITNIGIGLALLAALTVAVKKVPGMIEAKAEAALKYLFEHGDAADDAFLVAAINWAESKYGSGSGAAKASAVVDKIVMLLPLQYRVLMTKKVRAKAVELFQQSFDRLEKVTLAARDANKQS